MDENIVNTTEEIGEERLEQVAGGGYNNDEYRCNDKCWFEPTGNIERRDGMARLLCKKSTTIFVSCSRGNGVHRCGCFGTTTCVNGWHHVHEK